MEFKDVLRQQREEHKMTLQEVADAVGLQKSAIYKYEHGIVVNPKRTLIEKLANLFGVSPSYLMGMSSDKHPLPVATHCITIPLLGRVIAGQPIEAIENIEGYIELDTRQFSEGEYFALRIKGNSMEPRLLEDDVVVVRKTEDVDSGDTAIVLINGNEATCKQVKKSLSGITLIGFNLSAYTPTFYSNKDIMNKPVRIIGKVVESRHKW